MNLADYGLVMAGKVTPKKILLDESEMPTQWYNIVCGPPDARRRPALHPGTHEPAGPEDFAPLFPMALIEQEVSTERYIDIPGEVLDVYKIWRPSPFVPGQAARGDAGHSGTDLLQVRRW